MHWSSTILRHHERTKGSGEVVASVGVLSALVLLTTVSPLLGQSTEWRTDFSQHTVPLDEIVSGGPPKDGIPALDQPRFVSVKEADRWLDDREPVIVVVIGTDTKAYPLQILMWHEIVNDEVGMMPVAVTYCPLCNTALAFDRRIGDSVLDFGTTGRLRHSDLVMYDRQTESWWQQAVGEAIVGHYAGTHLKPVPAPLVNWRTFRDQYPDARVLSRETGFDRAYGRNPYHGYDQRAGPFARFFRGRRDERLAAMERVVTVDAGGEAVAFAFSLLATRRVVNDHSGDVPLAIFWTPGTASAVDAEVLSDGRDVGATTVFERQTTAGVLEFEAAGDSQFRDRETGSTWDQLGRAVAGSLTGMQLTPVAHGTPFWFAWAVFRPEARLVR